MLVCVNKRKSVLRKREEISRFRACMSTMHCSVQYIFVTLQRRACRQSDNWLIDLRTCILSMRD